MLIQTKNLTLIYENGKNDVTAVNEVNMTLPEKGFFGILGPSGSGKTSLLYLLSGIKRPTLGTIIYRGETFPQSSGARNKIRKEEMGFVFQHHFLINYLSTEQNILIGASRQDHEAQERVRELIAKLGLEELEKRPPYKLSGGQRQRVAIGRAFANEPKVVFVDEPTASLDHKTGQKVVKLLKDYSKNACVLSVTHDPTILKGADGVFKMWDGRLEAGS
ncbi:ABC transporter ATP-binding protein [Candidatus Dojkabacteria bacterium]|nr:ABC transporter ATP-binding protein [Candidatus Dojkabacteria bacterium]